LPRVAKGCWWHGQLHLLVPPCQRGDFAAGLRIAHQAQIGGVVSNRFINAIRAHVIDMQVGAGTGRPKLLLQMAQLRKTDRVDRCDPHGPFHVALESFQFEFEFLLAAQSIAAKIGVEPSGGGQIHWALAAVDQTRTEALFHLLQVLACCRLANPAMFRALRDASGRRDLFEKPKLKSRHG